MIGRCIILTTYGEYEKAFKMLNFSDDDFIIAADGGYIKALELNQAPSLIMGDFDSVNENNLPTAVEIIKFPSKKDDTDTLLAVKEGLKRGYKGFVILGGIGGRIDHTYANIQVLNYISQSNCNGFILDNETKILLLKNTSYEINDSKGFGAAVFSYSEIAEGVTLKGFEYNIDNGILTNDSPIGVSNIIVSNTAFIDVKNGVLLVMIYNSTHK